MNLLERELHYPLGDTLPQPGEAMEVAPGVRWIRMRLPFALDHINLWLLRDTLDGVAGRRQAPDGELLERSVQGSGFGMGVDEQDVHGGSMRSTLAPRLARNRVATGPAIIRVRSSTLMPSSGRASASGHAGAAAC